MFLYNLYPSNKLPFPFPVHPGSRAHLQAAVIPIKFKHLAALTYPGIVIRLSTYFIVPFYQIISIIL